MTSFKNVKCESENCQYNITFGANKIKVFDVGVKVIVRECNLDGYESLYLFLNICHECNEWVEKRSGSWRQATNAFKMLKKILKKWRKKNEFKVKLRGIDG